MATPITVSEVVDEKIHFAVTAGGVMLMFSMDAIAAQSVARDIENSLFDDYVRKSGIDLELEPF